MTQPSRVLPITPFTAMQVTRENLPAIQEMGGTFCGVDGQNFSVRFTGRAVPVLAWWDDWVLCHAGRVLYTIDDETYRQNYRRS